MKTFKWTQTTYIARHIASYTHTHIYMWLLFLFIYNVQTSCNTSAMYAYK